jgi:hypothetical protein
MSYGRLISVRQEGDYLSNKMSLAGDGIIFQQCLMIIHATS